MDIRETHPPFDLAPPAEAIRLQERLRKQVRPSGDAGKVSLVAGADASYTKGDDVIHAVVVALRYPPDLTVVERVSAATVTTFPYIPPGLLTFREGPALIEAFRRLRSEPDVIFFDGQGIAHPRGGLGIASHMGVLLDRPTVGGVAKSLLVGTAAEPAVERGGSTAPDAPRRRDDRDGGADERAGETRLRLRGPPDRSCAGGRPRPLGRTGGYRLPEPTRQAHLYANTVRRERGAGGANDRPASPPGKEDETVISVRAE